MRTPQEQRAVFNPVTMEAFSSHGNGTMTIIREKLSHWLAVDLQTMAGPRR